MVEIVLKNGREKSIIRRHPWIFSGAIDKLKGSPVAGETVDVISSKGEFLAKAAYNSNSKIIGRIWTWDQNEQVDADFFSDRLEKAIINRKKLEYFIHSDAMRLVHGESDALPGLILDQYQDTCVVQFLTAGVEFWKNEIVKAIIEKTKPKAIYERSDIDVRKLEGLPIQKGLLYGNLPKDLITITENDIKFKVDIVNGHKTGFYLDQRENRLYARMLSNGSKVLDCFSYTGGFGINALYGGAKSISSVDSSSQALSLARENAILNNLSLECISFTDQDVFTYMRKLRDIGETFDLVILDPPKFAPTKSQSERASRGYKDVNLLALKLLRNGGYLLTFSCSGGVSEELFQKIVSGAALDAGVETVILKRLHQAIDHPVALNFPEGAYLKGFIVQKQG